MDEELTKTHEVNKTFTYSKGKVTLSFTLNIDTTKDLKDFVELLKVATMELSQEINK